MRWSKICLRTNLLTVILSLVGFGTLYWLIKHEFHDLPEKNIWTSAQCQVLKNYQNGFYEVQVLGNLTLNVTSLVNDTDMGLCGWDRFNRNLSLDDFFNCQIPPVPLVVEACGKMTPITNLILLDEQATEIHQLLDRHLEYYWSAIGCLILASLCCLWCCYSYWFTWCGCQEISYWYCGRSNYKHFFNNTNEDFDDVFRVNFE